MSPDEFTGGPVDPFTEQQIRKPGPLPYADITNPQSLNKYAYVLNNPLRYTDPDGHFACAEPLSCTMEGVALGSLGGPPGALVGGLIGSAIGLGIVYIGQKAYNYFTEDQKAKENEIPATPANVEPKAQPLPKTGGGKNAPKINPDRVKSAQEKLQDLIKQREALQRKPNKTPEDKLEQDRLDRQIKRERERMKKSEEHSRREKH